jgi:hypothetical protein
MVDAGFRLKQTPPEIPDLIPAFTGRSEVCADNNAPLLEVGRVRRIVKVYG